MAHVGGATRVRRWAGLAHPRRRWSTVRDGQLVLVRGMRGQLVLAGALEGEEARLGEGLERLGGIGRDVDLTGGLDGTQMQRHGFLFTTEEITCCVLTTNLLEQTRQVLEEILHLNGVQTGRIHHFFRIKNTSTSWLLLRPLL